MSTASIEKALDENYRDWRRLPDGEYIALLPLLFTTAIVMEVNEWGYSRRYCFSDHELAVSEYNRLQNIDDEPQGWIAKRGA